MIVNTRVDYFQSMQSGFILSIASPKITTNTQPESISVELFRKEILLYTIILFLPLEARGDKSIDVSLTFISSWVRKQIIKIK